MGLSLDDSQILTKMVLRRKSIGKGNSQKYYYPDYLISIRGIPIIVIEAKKPHEDLLAAYSEARLYADEVNAGFPHNINACQIVIATDGLATWVGYSDHVEPEMILLFDDFNAENVKYAEFLEFCDRSKLEALADKPYKAMRGKAIFNTPVSQLGGKRVQNEELEENSFGRTFVLENRNIFDPETEDERRIIVENAYIISAKREQHIEPLYKEIRKFELPSKINTTAIATENPIELVEKISKRIEDKFEAYSLMLLIGNVGSGKTTFIRYFKRMFLEKRHPALAQKCDWIFLNMNSAPLTNDEIYSWIKYNMIEQIKENHREIDFYDIEVIKKVFQKEVRNFHNGIGQLLKNDEISYNKELYELLKNNLDDVSSYLTSLLFFLKENFELLPIVVLDNCDKRNKHEQLLMFQVSQWLHTTFKCIVILPMRDSTYDLYKNEPPLDTVVKDLVFRIDPPDLFKVIQARLDYIIRITNQTDSTYMLKNGINVSIKRSELIEYFKRIMLAIRSNSMASNIFYRLSDRNTRNGIQIFEDFCKSGHILADDIFKIRLTDHEYELPPHKFLNALLRKNRRYYNGEESNFINLFHSNYGDDFPDPFVRIDILCWLKIKINEEGPTKNKGLFPAMLIVKGMQILGHSADVIKRELSYLVRRGLIFSETLTDCISGNDLVKIAIPGLLHLKLLTSVIYLSACAEDVLFKDTDIMTCITHRLATRTYLSKLSMALTANDMITYLCNYRDEFCSHPETYIIDGEHSEIYNMTECKSAIEKWIIEDKYVKEWFDNIQKYSVGSKVLATITNKIGNGSLVCLIEGNKNIKGFISSLDSKCQLEYKVSESINEDDQLKCEILRYDYDHNNFYLKLIL